MSQLQQASGQPASLPSNSLSQCLRELFTTIEEVYESGQSIGDAGKFFGLLEGSTELLPVSVLRKIRYWNYCTVNSVLNVHRL